MNAPFVGLAVRRKGWPFTVRSTVSVGLLSAFRALHPAAVPEITVDPVHAALTTVDPLGVLLSAAGVVVLDLVLVLNHRPGRYLGH